LEIAASPLAKAASASAPGPKKFAMSKTVGPVPVAGCARLALPSSGAVAKYEEASVIARRRVRDLMQ
jgi:hypothetical protein